MTMELEKVRTRARREPVAAASIYDADFHLWAEQQARFLRAGRVGDLDLIHIAEEIETIGRIELRSLRSAIRTLMLHMMKWDHQRSKRSTSWVYSIRNARFKLGLELRDSPSLKSKLAQAIEDAYPEARHGAARQMRIDEDRLPETCPYTMADLLDRPFTIDRG